jgi:hypothetical protein
MKDSQTKCNTTNILLHWAIVVVIVVLFLLLGRGAAAITWRCLTEDVLDRYIQANYYIQDIISWSAFMGFYYLEQDGD